MVDSVIFVHEKVHLFGYGMNLLFFFSFFLRQMINFLHAWD